MPELDLREIEVSNIQDGEIYNKQGDLVLFRDISKSLVDVSREKADSVAI